MVVCVKDNIACEIQVRTRYLAVVKPTRADAEGLLNSLGEALSRMNIFSRECSECGPGSCIVGAGTDGASVNVGAHGGMKATLQNSLPWLFWSWCFVYRLELACKDAFISPLFHEISVMLLRLYYLSQELTCIVEDFKEVFDLPGFAREVPWYTMDLAQVNFFTCVNDKFGAYIVHLSSLCQDLSDGMIILIC